MLFFFVCQSWHEMRADTEDWKRGLRWWKRWASRKEWEVNFVPLKSYFFFVFFCILCVSTTLRASLPPLSFWKLDSIPPPHHPSFFPLQSPIYTFLNVFFFFHAPMVLPKCYPKKIISEWWQRTEGIQPTTYETKKKIKLFHFAIVCRPPRVFLSLRFYFIFIQRPLHVVHTWKWYDEIVAIIVLLVKSYIWHYIESLRVKVSVIFLYEYVNTCMTLTEVWKW